MGSASIHNSIFSDCVCGLPLIIWDAYSHQKYFKAIAWPTAGFGALVAIGVTGYLMLNHIVYFSRPNQQRYILRVTHAPPLSSSLDCTGFQRFKYLTLFNLRGRAVEGRRDTGGVAHGGVLLRRCRNGVLNFVVLGPILALGLILAYSMDRNYTQGEFSPSGTWFWLTIVNILSQLNFCLSIELAVLSFVQLFAFSHKPYMDKEPLDFRVSCRLFCDYTDLQRDIKDHSGKMMRDITTLGRNNEGSTTDEDDTSSHDEEKMKENWSSPDKDMFVYSKDISDDSSTSEV
ncbi:hypothetical protein BSL78_24914 [Apostichopus japonicus]|uniref:Transmembrane protein n=1 Tax=Stichopus japonicus TaxID=307972 RepID=A0A2G8JR41_STIJA|nr:hypothetical protein BSL78_24914 [Apostichopus japonicus]